MEEDRGAGGSKHPAKPTGSRDDNDSPNPYMFHVEMPYEDSDDSETDPILDAEEDNTLNRIIELNKNIWVPYKDGPPVVTSKGKWEIQPMFGAIDLGGEENFAPAYRTGNREMQRPASPPRPTNFSALRLETLRSYTETGTRPPPELVKFALRGPADDAFRKMDGFCPCQVNYEGCTSEELRTMHIRHAKQMPSARDLIREDIIARRKHREKRLERQNRTKEQKEARAAEGGSDSDTSYGSFDSQDDNASTESIKQLLKWAEDMGDPITFDDEEKEGQEKVEGKGKKVVKKEGQEKVEGKGKKVVKKEGQEKVEGKGKKVVKKEGKEKVEKKEDVEEKEDEKVEGAEGKENVEEGKEEVEKKDGKEKKKKEWKKKVDKKKKKKGGRKK